MKTNLKYFDAMNSTVPKITTHLDISFEIYVGNKNIEAPAFLSMEKQLSELFARAGRPDYKILIRFLEGEEWTQPKAACSCITIISLLGELLDRDTSFKEISEKYHNRIQVLVGNGNPVFICSIFRHVPNETSTLPTERIWMKERIARLNLLAAELSQSWGVNVIDIDRNLAHLGARKLSADYLLRSKVSTLLSGHVILDALLAAGLDLVVADECLEMARRLHGGFSRHKRLHQILNQYNTSRQTDDNH